MGLGSTFSGLTTPRGRRIAIIGVVAIAAVAGMIAVSGVWSGAQRLNATVHFDSQRFQITNGDTFEWRNVDLELNHRYHRRPGNVPAGRAITFLASQFI